MILHTVNKSPFDSNTLCDCLRIATGEDTILLIENGVYGAIDTQHGNATHSKVIKQLREQGTRFYVLVADTQARGIVPSKLLPSFATIDAKGFVALTTEASAIQSWY